MGNSGLIMNQGFCINSAVDRMNLSGRNLTDYMRKLLMGAGYMFQTSAELEIVKDIKEKITYVAENVAEEGRKRDGKSKIVDLMPLV